VHSDEVPKFAEFTHRFAAKLLQDVEAVVAAMVMPYCQGQPEGRVNKLKFIKRDRSTGAESLIC
jgi:transposase